MPPPFSATISILIFFTIISTIISIFISFFFFTRLNTHADQTRKDDSISPQLRKTLIIKFFIPSVYEGRYYSGRREVSIDDLDVSFMVFPLFFQRGRVVRRSSPWQFFGGVKCVSDKSISTVENASFYVLSAFP